MLFLLILPSLIIALPLRFEVIVRHILPQLVANDILRQEKLQRLSSG